MEREYAKRFAAEEKAHAEEITNPLQIKATPKETTVGNSKRYSCQITVLNTGAVTASEVNVKLMDFNPAPSRWYKTEETVPHPKFSMLLRAIATTDPTSVYINSHGEQQYELFNMVRAGNMPTVELVDADGETAPFQAEAEGWDGSVPTFKSYAFTIRAVAKGLPEAVQKFGLEFTKDANGIWMFKVEPV